MIPHVKKDDFYRVEGKISPHVHLLYELEMLGGEEWDGVRFRNHVLNEMDLNIDKTHSDDKRIIVYNKIIDAYNAMKESKNKDILCDILSIKRMHN